MYPNMKKRFTEEVLRNERSHPLLDRFFQAQGTSEPPPNPPPETRPRPHPQGGGLSERGRAPVGFAPCTPACAGSAAPGAALPLRLSCRTLSYRAAAVAGGVVTLVVVIAPLCYCCCCLMARGAMSSWRPHANCRCEVGGACKSTRLLLSAGYGRFDPLHRSPRPQLLLVHLFVLKPKP